MKMVKSLLLGGAAGLLAVAGAQAADMPVKVKAVEYVKICSLYGDGFYYIPGTDTCLKIAGFVRYQVYAAHGEYESSATNGPFFGNGGVNTRGGTGTDYIQRTRTMFTMDARTQTDYGTLRSVLSGGVSYDTPTQANATAGIYANRAFIQLAGFTFGQAVSFFDFYSTPIISYFGLIGNSDTGDGGWKVAAYTQQFGNGLSATISLEEPRTVDGPSGTSYGAVSNANVSGAFTQVTAGPVNGAGGSILSNQSAVLQRVPDLVVNGRIDQAWGSAQVMAALHDSSSSYYNGDAGGAAATLAAGTGPGNCTTPFVTQQSLGVQNCGHPADKWGFAVGAGILVKLDAISKGDYFEASGLYTEGALRYLIHTPGAGSQASGMGSNFFSLGILTDAIYGNPGNGQGVNGSAAATGGAGGNVELTTAWAVTAAYDHRWNDQWKTSLYGGYLAISFNQNAKDLICANISRIGAPGALSTANTAGTARVAGTNLNCSPDWQVWEVGSRTQWDVTRGLYVGVDVLYRKLETGFGGSVLQYTSNTARPSGLYTARDSEAWVGTFRIHRDFPY